ncbi:fungal-specific transcription factor domain-containing protein [Plectosphaerella cucumerina]|uniref:Fungal-specific transcription factor domain-containing protein n=1 Tax=Plectosphaerella cucumerina TaxID=40658 RepID=A0A8K0TR90_9PEZI|nr:fungal-specific transcription factor domain-containing protein [Plectosphaerella cucumerina]
MDLEQQPNLPIDVPPPPGPRAESSTSSKRRYSTVNGEPVQRQKRAKYTPNACKQCKKRKLKCIKSADDADCQRCLDDGAVCVTVVAPASSTNGRGKDSEAEKEATQRPGQDVISTESHNANRRESSRIEGLTEDISRLQAQVTSLVQTMRDLTEGRPRLDSIAHQQVSPAYSANARTRQKSPVPMQPHFVGPTRSAFSLRIAESSLTRMGIGSSEVPPPSAPESRTGSPGPSSPEPPPAAPSGSGPDPLLSFPTTEIIRLLDVFQEEVESVYPFIETSELAPNVTQILDIVYGPPTDTTSPQVRKSRQKDLRIIKVAVATAIVIEAHGRNDDSARLVDSVESEISVASRVDVDLKEVQLNTMLSIFYFHCDEELLAWRLIGTAARAALEMGLHRKQSLIDNFPEVHHRNLAVRVFWCIYALDRRWSFGTSLSFALHDRDIDPELPEPGEDFLYLGCMVAYGRLCSRVWEALPPFGSTCIPKDTAAYLDYMAQNWLASIPRELQLRHPRLGLAPRMQPRVLHRLRALLYLRGNNIRTILKRQHVLSTAAIEADVRAARNVVDIAQDSLQVLVHLNDSSDIYARQQSAFNYFLLSSLAVIFLAVCHAPAMFADQCRDSFLAALELVKGFSRHGNASRRLWKSIRGLVPRVKSLGLRSNSTGVVEGARAGEKQPEAQDVTQEDSGVVAEQKQTAPDATVGADAQIWQEMWPPLDQETSPGLSSSVPDAFHMSVDLMSLFDSFGMPPDPGMPPGPYRAFDGMLPIGEADEISRRFQGLI